MRGGEVWPKFANCFSEAGAGKSSPCLQGPKNDHLGTSATCIKGVGRAVCTVKIWREDVKIGAFLDNVRSQSARMPLAGFLGFN